MNRDSRRGTCFAYGLLIVGCGGSNADAGSKDTTGVDWSRIDPPSNIDITTCVQISNSAKNLPVDQQTLDRCVSCCQGVGFVASSFINDDHCTCGSSLDDGRDTVCAAQASSADACRQCCDAAGFLGQGWSGGGAGSSCRCSIKRDDQVCAPALDHAEPGEACSYCCLENGYLSSGYTGIGARECACIDP